MSSPRDYLLLNVGFLLHQNVGFVREFPLELPDIHLPPDVDLADLAGSVHVTRTAQGLLLQVKASARIKAECVRCLGEFLQDLYVDFTELYAFSQKSVTESGLVVPENGKIDLAPLLREEMLLAIPIHAVCKPDCRGLCPVCGANRNEVACHHEEEDAGDAPLSILGSLLG